MTGAILWLQKRWEKRIKAAKKGKWMQHSLLPSWPWFRTQPHLVMWGISGGAPGTVSCGWSSSLAKSPQCVNVPVLPDCVTRASGQPPGKAGFCGSHCVWLGYGSFYRAFQCNDSLARGRDTCYCRRRGDKMEPGALQPSLGPHQGKWVLRGRPADRTRPIHGEWANTGFNTKRNIFLFETSNAEEC